VVESLVEMYGFIGQERNISFRLQTQSCRISADPVRIRQAIGNIIDNAVKYSPDDSTIEISMKDKSEQISIVIKDYGQGITKEDLPFIWDRLYRSPGVRVIPGTGLGLSLVKAIVTAHKGSVDVESTYGSGSVFTICFPKE
jgi:signal transduction histidine kinase